MRIKLLLVLIIFFTSALLYGQCPQVYDGTGTASSKPYWINCTGGAYTLNLSSPSSINSYTVVWGDGTANTTGASLAANTILTHNYASAIDTFIIQLITSTPSCTLSGVVVMEKPVNASIQIPVGGVTTACAPATLQFMNSSTDVSQTTSFSWNFGDGSPTVNYNYTNDGQTISHTYNKGTVNCQTIVTLNAMNYCTFGTPTKAQFNPIQIYDKDQAAITPDAPIKCWPDNAFTYTNTTSRNCFAQGNNGIRYEKWDFGNYWGTGHDSIINWTAWPPSFPKTVAYPGLGNYTVILYDSNQCGVDTTRIQVSIVSKPTAGLLVHPDTVCLGTALTFTNTSSTGYAYKWNFGDNGTYTATNHNPQTHTYAAPGNYTVSVVAYINGAPNSCKDTARIVVTVLPSPLANFTFNPNNGCNTLNTNFTDASSNAISWQWNFGNGNSFSGQNPSVQTYTTGSYTVSLQVTSADNCSNTKKQTLTVYQKPVPQFTTSASCLKNAVLFTDQSTHAAGDNIINWSWNFGDGGTINHAQNPTHTYTVTNTYTVQLIVNTTYCSDSVQIPITVNPLPILSFSNTPDSGCSALSVQFTNNTSGATGYVWNFGNGSTSTNINPIQTFSNATTSSISYSCTLVATSAAGCKDSLKNTVKVFGKPIASFSSNAAPSCAPFTVTYTNTSQAAINYLWNFGDGSPTSNVVAPNHVYQNTSGFLQNYTITLHVTNAGACQDSVKQVIQAYPQAQFNFQSLPDSGCTPLLVNFPAAAGAVLYQWNFGDGSPVSNAFNPIHTYTNTGLTTSTYTVQLIAVNAFNCSDTVKQPVYVFPKPKSLFTMSKDSGCLFFSVIFTNHSINANTYNWSFGDGSGTPGKNTGHTYTFANNPTGLDSFQVSLTANNVHGCKDTSRQEVYVFPQVKAGFSCDTIGCSLLQNNFINTSLNASVYSWNFGDGSPLSTLANPAHTYSNTTNTALTFTVQLSAKSIYGCTSIFSQQITVYPKPTASFSLSATTGCSPFMPSLSNLSTGATAGYHWNFGDGNTSTQTNPGHTFTNTSLGKDSFNLQLIVSNTFACKDTLSRYVYVLPSVKTVFSCDSIGCSPFKTNFTNTSSGASTYTWTFGDASTNSNAINPSHTYSNSTNSIQQYTVFLMGSNGFNCPDTAYRKITIYPKPAASFTLTALTGCSQFSPGISNTSTGATAGSFWNFGDGNTSAQVNPVHSYTNTALVKDSFNLQLVVANTFGCKDTANRFVSILPKVKASFSCDTLACSPLKITGLNASQGANTYTWNFGDASASSSLTNPVHTYTNTSGIIQTYTCQLIANNTFNCPDTARQKISIEPKPIASFHLSPDSSCSPLTPVYNNTSQGSSTVFWNFGDGTTSSFSNPSHSFVNTSLTSQDSFHVQLVVGNGFACKDTAQRYAYVFPKVVASFYADTPICAPVSVSFHNQTQSTTQTTYTWNFGDGNPLDNSAAPSHTYNNTSGNTLYYTVTLAATNAFGCSASFSHTYAIFPKPTALFSMNPPGTQIYPASTVGFTNLTANAGSFSNYWNFGDGHSSTVVSPGNHLYSTWGTYSITLVVSSAFCKDSMTKVEVITPPKPIAGFSGGQKGCAPLQVTFQSTSQYATSYYWAFGDGNTQSGSDSIVTHQYNNPGSYTVKLVAIGPGGRDTVIKVNDVEVYAIPVALFTIKQSPPIVTVGVDPITCTLVNTSAASYIWNFGDNSPDITTTNPSHIYQQPGQFVVTLIAVSSHGCRDTFQYPTVVIARTETNIQIPNAFTPNTGGPSLDGVYDPTSHDNDIFHPNITGLQTYELDIFNRWGELLFVSKDIKVGWDGYFKGRLCELGVYVWKIRGTTLDGQTIEKAGDLTLLR